LERIWKEAVLGIFLEGLGENYENSSVKIVGTLAEIRTEHLAIFYCLRFETSLFVASYDSQGHGGGIRPRHRTGNISQLTELLVLVI
jgi:hypothetical protein